MPPAAQYTLNDKPRPRVSLVRVLLIVLNVASTALALLTGLRENPLVVAVTGRYDGIRQRLRDGSINTEIATPEVYRLDKLTPLEDIGAKYRFITAPRREPSTIGEYRSVCTNLNSNSALIMSLVYDDFWGTGPRRVQVFVYSISALQCQVINVKPAWRSKCIADRGGNATACHRYVLDNFETLQQNRLILVGAAKDFGDRDIPLLRCLARPNATFHFDADLLAHQTYWSGAAYHVMIQTSKCRAVPLLRNSDLKYGLFESQNVDEGADVLMALPPSGWVSWIVTQAYSIVTVLMIVHGIVMALFHNRTVRYLPHDVRYNKERRLLQYVVPFMPASIFFSDQSRLVITFKCSMVVASDVWMNHWLYMYLSIADALTNIRLTYVTLQVGTWMVNMKVTMESFLFLCAALTKITWIMCLIQTLVRIVLKIGVRCLRAMRIVKAHTRAMLEWHIDGASMFLTGIPQITHIWNSEVICDLFTLLGILTLCGQVVGIGFMLTKLDGLMAANMLGLNPGDPDFVVDGRARTKSSLGSLLQLLCLSGPSAFVHLAGDYIFHGGGFTQESVKFRYLVASAMAMGLVETSQGSATPTANATAHCQVLSQAMGTSQRQLKISLFERHLRIVTEGYLGKTLLVDEAQPGLITTNKESGMREFVVIDALATISILDVKYLLGNDKKLRAD